MSTIPAYPLYGEHGYNVEPNWLHWGLRRPGYVNRVFRREAGTAPGRCGRCQKGEENQAAASISASRSEITSSKAEIAA